MIGYEWTFDPFVTIPLALSGGLYATGVVRLWARAGIGESVRRWQAACFAAGWLSLLVALVTPLHEVSEHLFTAHMVQHELLVAVAAPLLALSRPVVAILRALPRSWRENFCRHGGTGWVSVLWRWLTRPLDATLLHGAAIWIWHIPALFDAAVTDEVVHRLQHLSFLATALLFWWALFRGSRNHLGVGAFHIAFTMVHTSILGALIALSPRILYLAQTKDAPAFGLTPLEDQQIGGLIMWVPMGTIYAAIALAMIGSWMTARSRRPSYAE
jgi:putative membrane protein